VVDTSVIVSAFLKPDGTSRKALSRVVENHVLLTSFEILAELNKVLVKPKFQRVFTPVICAEILALLLRVGEMIEVKSAIKICRDPDDDKFVNLALDGHADFLVSRDPDLLVLKSVQSVRVVSPGDFLLELP
jgi:putative PIN family toxin of toxin-antitoxin system